MIAFILTNILLGTGLAMDAFSVSVANGLREPQMAAGRRGMIAGTYALFQILMPILGWICVRTAVNVFTKLQAAVPYLALGLLMAIGIKMIAESLKKNDDRGSDRAALGGQELILQGLATSIDALSVGFTFALYDATYVFSAAVIIGAVTFVICLLGLALGRTVGMRFTRYSDIAGGLILIAVGVSIFIKNISL